MIAEPRNADESAGNRREPPLQGEPPLAALPATPVGPAVRGADRSTGFARLLGRLEIDSVAGRAVAAVMISAIAIVARSLLTPIVGTSVPFLLYFPAIVVAASVGGHWTGSLTVLLCATGQAVLFEEPTGTPFIADAAQSVRLLLFLVIGELIALVTGAAFSARRASLAGRHATERLYRAEAGARADLEAAEQRTRVLYETAAGLSDAVTPEDVADVIIRQGVHALGAGAGAVLTVTPDRAGLRVLRAAGYPPDLTAQANSAALDGRTAPSEAVLSGQPVFLEDRAADTRRYPGAADAHRESGTEALAAVPLGPGDAPLGVLVLSFPTRREFPTAERELILALAHECSQALERARLYRAEQDARRAAEAAAEAESAQRRVAEESARTLALVAAVSEALAASADVEENLQVVAGMLVPGVADWMSVDVLQPDGTVKALAVEHVDPGRRAMLRSFRDQVLPLGSGDSSRVIESGEPVVVPVMTESDIRAQSPSPETAELAIGLGTRSYLAVPMHAGGRTIGALALGSLAEGRFSVADVPMITELARRTAAALEHARVFRDAQQLIATVDATLDAVFMFEPSTLRFTYVNQGAIAQVGYDRGELLSMRAIDIKPDFDERRYRQLLAPLIDGSRDHLTFTTVHRHRDGFAIPVEVFLQHVRLPGGEARMIITSRDVRSQIDVQAALYRLARAERARAAELSAVIQGMSEGVLVCDADGRVVLANQAAAAILGAPVDGYAELASRLDPGDRRLPALGTTTPPVEVRLRDQDRWLEVGSSQVAPDAGDPSGGASSTILVLRDVTEARQAQAAREAFIGVLSHELRTPITTIYGNTKVMRRVTDPATQRQMLSDVEEEADRLYRLVEDLLILSRAESGRLRLEGEPVLIQHLIPSVLASERARWPGHTFRDRVEPGLPPVAADRTYLEQVVRNLVTNAAKYGPEGGSVEVRAELTPETAVTVRVLDEGPGVPEDEQSRVFELFYRSAASSRRASGAGIGLYVCRVLVEGMGGRIWTRRRPEGGAEFGFTVPVLIADGVDGSDHDADQIGIDTGGASGRRVE